MSPKDVNKQLIAVVKRFTAAVAVIPNDRESWQRMQMATQRLNQFVATTFSQEPTGKPSKEFLTDTARRLKLLDAKIGELEIAILGNAIRKEKFDDVANMRRLLALSDKDLSAEAERIEHSFLTAEPIHPLLYATTVGVGYSQVVVLVNGIKEALAPGIVEMIRKQFPDIPEEAIPIILAFLKFIINLVIGGLDGLSVSPPQAGGFCFYEVRLDYIQVKDSANTGQTWKFDIDVAGLDFNQPQRTLESDGNFPISRKVARIGKPGCEQHEIKVKVEANQFDGAVADVGYGEETFTVNCGADDEFGLVRFRVYNTPTANQYSTVEVGFDIESECMSADEASGTSTGLLGTGG